MNLRFFYNPQKFREKRYRKIIELLSLISDESVLSLGCGEGLSFEVFNNANPITGVDLFPEKRIHRPNFKYIQRKGDILPFDNNEFDVVIALGVLEHITNPAELAKTCDEIQRVGKKYLVMIPWRWTLIEPHYSFPLFQLLPERMQKSINSMLGLRYAAGQEKIYEKINYLKTEEWLRLFPSGKSKIYFHIGPLVIDQLIYHS